MRGGEYGGGLREDTLGKKTLRAEKEGRRAPLLPGDETRKLGWGDPALVYDEEKELFRFRDDRFAFSRSPRDRVLK
jgi:hypothetical protein